MTEPLTWHRKFVNSLPITTAVVGVAIVFGSVFFNIDDTLLKVGLVSVGILALLMGIWYAANPFIKNERRYLALRAEVDRAINIVRKLNSAAIAGTDDQIQHAREALHDSVERMGELAGKADAPSA